MSRIKNKNTKPELLVRSTLHKNGFRFRLHDRKLPGSPDIVLKKYKTVIFVNGCFWHGHNCKRGKTPATNTEYWDKKIDDNKKRDKMAYDKLKTLNWFVIIIWSCQLSSKMKVQNTMYELMFRIKKNDIEEK